MNNTKVRTPKQQIKTQKFTTVCHAEFISASHSYYGEETLNRVQGDIKNCF